MSYQKYRLRYKLRIYERQDEGTDSPSISVKNLELSIFIRAKKGQFYRFDQLETIIDGTLKKFTLESIEKIEPFNKIGVDLEKIASVFFYLLKRNFALIGAPLEYIEVSENPRVTHIVTDGKDEEHIVINGVKVSLRRLLLTDFVSSSTEKMAFEAPKIVYKPAPKTVRKTTSLKNGEDEEAKNEEKESNVANEELQAPDNALEEESKKSKKKNYLGFLIGVIVLALVGLGLSMYLYYTGLYPSGADIYGHLFKSDLAYKSVLEGNYYPLHTELWYNGLQPYRYWAPLPYYIIALFQFVSGGDPLISYLWFVAFAVIIGGIGWLIWGMLYRRIALGIFIALLWFFIPDNMRIFFVEGNIPRMTIAIMMPYLFFFIWRLVEFRDKKSSIPIVIIMCLINLCHVMIAAMIGIGTFVFLLIYSINRRRASESLYTLLFMLMSFPLCGPWLYPALKGGLVGMDPSATAEVMKALSTPASTSLNPFLRGQGGHELFYFGLSILVLSFFGLIFATRNARPGFIAAILIFFGTLPSMVPFLEKLPLNQLFWMPRFAPIACTLFMVSLFEWKDVKRYIILLMALLLIFDSYLSLDFSRYHSMTSVSLSHTINEAKEITKQRLTLMDISTYGSYPSFGISAEDPATKYTYGWAWQGASTAYNIMMLNSALERGHYHYLFDRCLELGDDTVMVQKQQLQEAKKTLEELKEGAAASNYYLAKETNEVYIFKRNTPATFGTVTKYPGLAIGMSANLAALEYPAFEEGVEIELNKYDVEELKKYEVIYLSGFSYGEKGNVKDAEEMIMELSKSGVRIIIDMNRIPSDSITRRMLFLEVNAQPVGFTDRFPDIIYQGEVYEPIPFEKEFMDWNTIYLDGLDKVWAYSWLEDKRLPVAGTKWNDNLIFLGFNLMYHVSESKDEAVKGILGNLFGFQENQLPERRVVPLTISYEKDKIIVDSPTKNVNTTIGFQDIFNSEKELENRTHLLMVDKGLTEIDLKYPNLREGIIVGILGLLAIIILYVSLNKKRGEKRESKKI